MTVTIYLGRHGETRLNSEKRLRSWLDEPLNRDGIQEANAMANQMKKYPIARIYSSDLDRANETAKIVAEKHNLKVIARQWFRPIDYGSLNGKKVKDIQDELDALNKIWETKPDHEVPGGESFKEFQDRNLGGLESVVRGSESNDSIMIVAHLRNCLLFHAVALTGGPLSGKDIQALAGKDWHQESGAVSKFEMNGKLEFKGIL